MSAKSLVSLVTGSLRKESQQESFESFMQKRVAAARAYVNGDAAPLDEIVATHGMASFFPPTGGTEQGAQEVNARYDRDVKSFAQGGETQLEVLQSASSGDIAFWTGFQIAKVKMGGAAEPVSMKLRITELFRREGGEWKMVHRHADAMAEPVKPGAGDGASTSDRRPHAGGASRGSQRSTTSH